jgi:glutaminyl-peptide cyclotransferase
MHGSKALLIAALIPAALAQPPEFNGARALDFTAKAVSFGPRPPGSPAIARLQAYIVNQLISWRCHVNVDNFVAQTPVGAVPMKNIIARFPGTSRHIVVITGHYDSKLMPGVNFVGANDGGSSTGFLLEMAEILRRTPHKDDIYLVWLDGEEAFEQWSESDSLYGSRQLAQQWSDDGTLQRVKALINVDMIGDKDLDILPDASSSASLRNLVWDTARSLGFGSHFLDQGGPIEDDHLPFARKGVNAIDLIDFDYAPWHTPDDTMDKLSAESLRIVGTVVLEVLKELERTQ